MTPTQQGRFIVYRPLAIVWFKRLCIEFPYLKKYGKKIPELQ